MVGRSVMRVRQLSVLFGVALLVSGCGDGTPEQTLSWHACADELECATLEVPNDHLHSDGSVQHIAVARTRASDPGARFGVLLYNMGGPGVASTDSLGGLRAMLSQWAPEIVSHFDIVAFDPRGIGRSTPALHYLSDDTIEALRALDPTLVRDADRGVHDAVADWVLQSAANSLEPRFASHVDTESVARDMDLLRIALGEPTVSYFGGSYGTLLGALYMTLFPAHVRAFVLDSPVMPAVDRLELMRGQAEGYEAAYTAFFDWCDATDTCPLHGRAVSEALPALDTMIVAANALPIAYEGRVVTGTDILLALGTGFEGKNAWPYLAEEVEKLLAGDVSGVLPFADAYYGRTADGTYGDDIVDAYTAISALDAPYSPGFDRPAFDAYVDDQVTPAGPHFGPAIAEGERVSVGWPFAKARPLPAVAAEAAPPALVLAGLNDPVTALRWAYELRDALGNGSSLTTREDWVHGQFFSNSCVRDRVVGFLVDPATPLDDASCPFEPAE